MLESLVDIFIVAERLIAARGKIAITQHINSIYIGVLKLSLDSLIVIASITTWLLFQSTFVLLI